MLQDIKRALRLKGDESNTVQRRRGDLGSENEERQWQIEVEHVPGVEECVYFVVSTREIKYKQNT